MDRINHGDLLSGDVTNKYYVKQFTNNIKLKQFNIIVDKSIKMEN